MGSNEAIIDDLSNYNKGYPVYIEQRGQFDTLHYFEVGEIRVDTVNGVRVVVIELGQRTAKRTA